MTTHHPNTFQHPNFHVDRLSHFLTPEEEKALTKKRIRIYDISTQGSMDIAVRLFHYGETFGRLSWKRNSKIEFHGTIYRLRKCKGKNDQKPGQKEIFEIRNPRNVTVIEFETNNRYRATSRRQRKLERRKEKAKLRRKELRALMDCQREDIAHVASVKA